MATLGSGMLSFGLGTLQGLSKVARNFKTIQELYVFLAILETIGIAIYGIQTYKTLKLFLKYRDISKDIQKIGDALLNSLIKAGAIKTDQFKLRVETSVDKWGAVFCHLEGGTTFDQSTFINALQEVISPIDNPRYVIIRKSRFMLFVKQKDYHSVPEILGRIKNLAEHFKTQWEKIVGACDLIFTRTLEGRKALLKSRVKSLSAQFEEKIEHVNKWR